MARRYERKRGRGGDWVRRDNFSIFSFPLTAEANAELAEGG